MVNPEMVETVFLAIGNELRFSTKYSWASDRFDIDDLQQSAIVAAYEGGLFGEHMPIGVIARHAINRAIADTFPDDDFAFHFGGGEDSVETDNRREQMLPETFPGKAKPKMRVGLNRRSSAYDELVTCPIVDAALCRLSAIEYADNTGLIESRWHSDLNGGKRLADIVWNEDGDLYEYGTIGTPGCVSVGCTDETYYDYLMADVNLRYLRGIDA